ncbi:hypothetical protein F5Y09DRAFT_260455 [Xylaria sp. FL1042]|nr:hypothetical protein F5Y09DRAFT_260455 [Xylaria sp. FL1042]
MSAFQSRLRRRGGPRSKSGCENCKARHIKCDETRPYCRRCIQKGWVCGGYSAVEGNQQITPGLVETSITAYYAIPFRIPGSQQDRRLLHYFCVRGAGDLSGHLGSEFWTRLVLQHSHDHVPVRQAVVALSCAHQCYIMAHDGGDPVPADAIVHYSRAMRSLRKHMSVGIDNKVEISAVIPLVCSILFCCFENMQGNTEAALRHLSSGIAILARQKERGRLNYEGRDNERLDLLEHMLARLDLQASMFDDARLPLMRQSLTIETEESSSDTFQTIDNAQADLTRLQSGKLQFLIHNETLKFWPEHDLPEVVKLEKQAIEEACTVWYEKLGRFVHDHSISPAEHDKKHDGSEISGTSRGEDGCSAQVRESAQDPAITILLIHYHIFRLLLSASLPHDPSVFGAPPGTAHYNTLNRILDLMESTPQARGAGSRSLGAETGIVAPLFLLIMKCTDPAVFERALNLLLAISGRREGMFDSRVLAEIAMRFASQHQTPLGTVALEWQAGDALEKRVNGLAGFAKNLGVIP